MAAKPSTGLVNGAASAVATFFEGGTITLFTGPQPASPDSAATGTPLGTFTALAFGTVAAGIVPLTIPHQSNAMTAAGTVVWARLHLSADDPLVASTTMKRMDFVVGATGADLNLGAGASTNIALGSIQTITGLTINMNP